MGGIDGSAIEALGLVAAFLTTGSFIPQVFRVWRTRDTAAISVGMYVMFSLGTVAWLIYGLAINSLSVVAANAVTFSLSITVLALKFNYRTSVPSPPIVTNTIRLSYFDSLYEPGDHYGHPGRRCAMENLPPTHSTPHGCDLCRRDPHDGCPRNLC